MMDWIFIIILMWRRARGQVGGGMAGLGGWGRDLVVVAVGVVVVVVYEEEEEEEGAEEQAEDEEDEEQAGEAEEGKEEEKEEEEEEEKEEEKEAERDALGGGCAREGDPGSNRPWGIGSCWPVDSWDGL